MAFEATDELLSDQNKILQISDQFATFLETAENLEAFAPGLFVTDISQPVSAEPHKMSICFRLVFLQILAMVLIDLLAALPGWPILVNKELSYMKALGKLCAGIWWKL